MTQEKLKKILEQIKKQNYCTICGTFSFPAYQCKNCNSTIKKILKSEAIIEFKIQLSLKPEEQNEIFKGAEFEIFHNYCYTPLSKIQYNTLLRKEFIEHYRKAKRTEKIKELEILFSKNTCPYCEKKIKNQILCNSCLNNFEKTTPENLQKFELIKLKRICIHRLIDKYIIDQQKKEIYEKSIYYKYN